jgi:hypothetical protein
VDENSEDLSYDIISPDKNNYIEVVDEFEEINEQNENYEHNENDGLQFN